MAEVEEITADLLDKKYLFNGFVTGKLQWDPSTLMKVYQRLLSVHSDGFDYEEDGTQAAHICKCLRLLGIGHLAPKSQDLADKSRALRIISALDDKISAKFKAHLAARRIRVIIKKEQKSKSHRPKPRPPTLEDSSQEEVFPVVPLPKPCDTQLNPVSETSSPIPKVVDIKRSLPEASAAEAVPSFRVTPKAQSFIPSGRQLQRTPVATTHGDNLLTDLPLSFASALENDVKSKVEPTNASETDNGVHYKHNVTVTSISPHPAHTCHEAGNGLASSILSKLDCGAIQSTMERKESVQFHDCQEAFMPPVPFSQESFPTVSPQKNHDIDIETEASSKKKINVIPSGQQIPRTPKTQDEILKYLEGNSFSSNEEMPETLDAQDTIFSPDVPEGCRDKVPSTLCQKENKNIEKEACHMGSIEPLSSIPSHEPFRMVNITSTAETSGDPLLLADGSLPVHCVLSPPSGYRDEEIHSETLEEKCSAVKSEIAIFNSPSVNPSLEKSSVQTNIAQHVTVTHTKVPTDAVYDYESPPSSDKNCGSPAIKASHTESPMYEVGNDDTPTSSVRNDESLASVVSIESPISEASFIAERSTSTVSDNGGTFVRNTENLFVSNTENTFVYNTDNTFVCNTDNTFVCNTDNTFVCNTDNTFVCNTERTSVCSTEKTFVCDNENTFMNYTEQSTPPVQDVTYLLPTKNLPDTRNLEETKMEFCKALDGTFIIPKRQLTENMISKTNIVDNQKVSKDETILSAFSKVNHGKCIDQMQKEKSFLTADDTFEIFPHKRTSSRLKDKASGIIANINEKPENMNDETYCNENETNKTTDDLKCPVIKEPILSEKVLKKRLVKAKIIPTEEIDTGSKNVGMEMKVVLKDINKQAKKGRPKINGKEQTKSNNLEIFPQNTSIAASHSSIDDYDTSTISNKNMKSEIEIDKSDEFESAFKNADDTFADAIFLKPKRTTVKVSQKRSKRNDSHDSETSNKENENQEQSLCDDQHTNSKEHKRCPKKSSKNLETKVEVCDDKDESKFDVIRKNVKPKGRPKKNSPKDFRMTNENHDIQEEKIVRSHAHQNTNEVDGDEIVDDCYDVQDEYVNVERRVVKPRGRRKKTEDEAANNEKVVKSRGRQKKSEDEDVLDEAQVKPKRDPKKSENEAQVKSKSRQKKTEAEFSDNEAEVKPKSRQKKTRDEKGAKSQGQRKTSEDIAPNSEEQVKAKIYIMKTKELSDDEAPVKAKGRPQKSDDQAQVKSRAHPKESDEAKVESKRPKKSDDEAPVKSKGRKKKTEDEALMKSKGQPKEDEDEVFDNEALVKSKGRKKKTEDEALMKSKGQPKEDEDEVFDNEAQVKSKGQPKETEDEVLDNEKDVKYRGRRNKSEDEVPDNEAQVKPKGRQKKIKEIPDSKVQVKSKGRQKKTVEIPDDETQVPYNKVQVKSKGRQKKIKEIPDDEVQLKSKAHSKKSDNEAQVKSKGRKKKTNITDVKSMSDQEKKENKIADDGMDIDEASCNETKTSEEVKDTSKKQNNEQPCVEAPRRRRACKVKALAAISELIDESWP